MRILHVIHDFLPRHRAGSEIYAAVLCRELRQRHHVVLLCAEYDPSRPHLSATRRTYEGLEIIEIVNNWEFTSFAESYSSGRMNAVLEDALSGVRPDVLHLHNLLNLSVDLPVLASARGIPVVATLHDYTLVCPSGGQRVHLAERHVCEDIDAERCSRCFAQSPFHSQMAFARVASHAARVPALGTLGRMAKRTMPRLFARVERHVARSADVPSPTPRDIRLRLDKVRRVFDAVDLFVAPSPALGTEYRRLGVPARKLRVSDYGFVPLVPLPRAAGAGRLRVGFVGTLTWHKGVHVLLEAVRDLPAGSFEVRIFGNTETFPVYVQSLREQAAGLPVSFMGGFTETQAASIYSQIDVLVVASLWPENSPLVIHEAFMAGVPVVGARMGGIADLVTHGENGLLYEAFSPGELRDALQQLISRPELVTRFAARLPQVKSIAQDAAEWERIYDSVVHRRAPAEDAT